MASTGLIVSSIMYCFKTEFSTSRDKRYSAGRNSERFKNPGTCFILSYPPYCIRHCSVARIIASFLEQGWVLSRMASLDFMMVVYVHMYGGVGHMCVCVCVCVCVFMC